MTSFCGTIVRGAELQNRIDVLVIQHAETGGIEVEVEYTVSFKEVEGGGFLAAHKAGWVHINVETIVEPIGKREQRVVEHREQGVGLSE